MVATNMVFGVFAISSWMGFIYFFIPLAEASASALVTRLLLFSLVAILVGPLIHLLLNIWRKEVRLIEGHVKIETEGLGSERRVWSSEIGVLANLSLLTALVTRNILRRQGVGRHPEDFKFFPSYSVVIGKRKFYTGIDAGRLFVDGAYYRVYYVSVYPLPVLVSAEALPAPFRT